jgi:hypothetical protein
MILKKRLIISKLLRGLQPARLLYGPVNAGKDVVSGCRVSHKNSAWHFQPSLLINTCVYMLTKMKESKCTKTKLIKAYDLFYIVDKVGTTTTLCKTMQNLQVVKALNCCSWCSNVLVFLNLTVCWTFWLQQSLPNSQILTSIFSTNFILHFLPQNISASFILRFSSAKHFRSTIFYLVPSAGDLPLKCLTFHYGKLVQNLQIS